MPLGVSLSAKTDTLLTRGMAKPIGLMVFLFGMLLFAWAAAYLRGAFLGNVETGSKELVTRGPYRFVRHPIYLGMVISAIGLAFGMRSLWGVLSVFLTVVPVGIYRARLEESAMAKRFGTAWENYVKRTFFMFPPVY